MKTVIFQLILLFFSLSCFAQYTGERANDYNSDYSRDQCAAVKSYEKQAELNRQPNSKTSTITPLSQAELREVAKIFERPKTAQQIAEKEIRDAETKRLSEAYKLEEGGKKTITFKLNTYEIF